MRLARVVLSSALPPMEANGVWWLPRSSKPLFRRGSVEGLVRFRRASAIHSFVVQGCPVFSRCTASLTYGSPALRDRLFEWYSAGAFRNPANNSLPIVSASACGTDDSSVPHALDTSIAQDTYDLEMRPRDPVLIVTLPALHCALHGLASDGAGHGDCRYRYRKRQHGRCSRLRPRRLGHSTRRRSARGLKDPILQHRSQLCAGGVRPVGHVHESRHHGGIDAGL